MFVNAIMYYKVKDATCAVANVDDYSGSARLLAATTLRNVLGTKNLGDILSEREIIANEMQELERALNEILRNCSQYSDMAQSRRFSKRRMS